MIDVLLEAEQLVAAWRLIAASVSTRVVSWKDAADEPATPWRAMPW
jgi:hypothetical protein